MAILHGSWLQNPSTAATDRGGDLFLWGETWRRVDEGDNDEATTIAPHPLAMTADELSAWLDELHQGDRLHWSLPKAAKRGRNTAKTAKTAKNPKTNDSPWQWRAIALPSHYDDHGRPIPLHSAADADNDTLVLHPWFVEGLCLNPTEAMQFLSALPLGTVATDNPFLGPDLRFWSHVARWAWDLLARCKFLPGLDRQLEGKAIAQWLPLLDSNRDRDRLNHFARQMPLACRTYQGHRPDSVLAVDFPQDPRPLLRHCLQQILDRQIRQGSDPATLPPLAAPVGEWLHALCDSAPTVAAEPDAIQQLERVLETWTAPVKHHLGTEQEFRACFTLEPPTPPAKTWRLKYGLQAADEPEWTVDASAIWDRPVEQLIEDGRAIVHPQETLLAGLGLACRLYPHLEPSLDGPRPEFCSLSAIEAYQFIKSVAWRLQENGLGVILPPNLSHENGWASRLGLAVRAEKPKTKMGSLGLQSLLNFKWELTIGGQRVSKAEFEKLVALDSPLVEINGEWVELRDRDIRAAQTFFKARKDKLSLSLEDALRLSTGDTQTIEQLPVVNFESSGQLEELLNTLTDNRTLEEIDAPDNFKGQLRPYQARGVGWLRFLQQWGLGACLADDMGLGKTIETIAFLQYLKQERELEHPVLLVCPTSVLGNWEREVKRFAPDLSTYVHHGDKRPKGKNLAKTVKNCDIVITSYPLVYRDEKDLKAIAWQGVILDEAQNIKNPDAKQSKAVREIAEASTQPFRVGLTGTPVENRLQELWSIMDFLNPGYLGAKAFFQRRFAIPIEKYGDTDSLQTLRSLVRPFILRRLKTDKEIIQDLPEKQEMPVFCGLSTQQAKLYQKIVDESLAEIEASDGIQRRGIILALLVKLKQVCNHPVLIDGKGKKGKAKNNKSQEIVEELGQSSGKLKRLEEMVDEVLSEGDRALIFTQFAEWGKLLQPYLQAKFNREILFLYGSTRKQQREEMVDRFQHDPQGPPIMILSLKAGGVGLNLTRANHVFHFDRWWNPAVENQATDRVFRIGQKRNVQVHKFVCSGTLEEKIHDLIESKKALAEQVVGAGEQWLTELDTDGLRNLLVLDRNAVMEEEEG
ncbi:MAG: DEAD/DEAH box helicase [Cyanobacteria bacterium J007]|nr:MAG: DEAD/DEAH box helicase [Cyanobacteria bacterium J007]